MTEILEKIDNILKFNLNKENSVYNFTRYPADIATFKKNNKNIFYPDICHTQKCRFIGIEGIF